MIRVKPVVVVGVDDVDVDVEVGKVNSQQKCSHHMLLENHVLHHNLLGELHLLTATTHFSTF